MLSDSHAHLDSASLLSFVQSLENMYGGRTAGAVSPFRIISNSTDLESSKKNLELGRRLPKSIVPFVGIHPESVSHQQKRFSSEESVVVLIGEVQDLSRDAAGIGEIGIDPKYGSEEVQAALFESQIGICEGDRSLPVSIHSRGSVQRIEGILSTYHLSNRIMFHWFNGSEEELSDLQDRGYYVSFGPALIFSKRLQGLYLSAHEEYVLAETDSPLFLSSLPLKSNVSPFAVASVIFKMSRLKGRSFPDTMEQIHQNMEAFVSRGERKTH